MSNMLDRSRKFGRCLGSDTVFFKQDGFDFDSTGKVIPGSKNSGKPELVAAAPVAAAKLPFEDMHIQALKRHVDVVYKRLEAAGADFTPVEKGAGMQARLVEFLNEHG